MGRKEGKKVEVLSKRQEQHREAAGRGRGDRGRGQRRQERRDGAVNWPFCW